MVVAVTTAVATAVAMAMAVAAAAAAAAAAVGPAKFDTCHRFCFTSDERVLSGSR